MMQGNSFAGDPLGGLFGSMGAVDPNGGRGEFFTPGMYIVQVDRAFIKQSRDSGVGFILSCSVEWSNNDKHPPGCVRSVWWGLGADPNQPGQRRDMSLQNIKAMHIAASNVDYSTCKEQFDPIAGWLMKGSTTDANPMMGVRMRLECTEKMTIARPGKPAHPFTIHTFSPTPEGPHMQIDRVLECARTGRVTIVPAQTAAVAQPMGGAAAAPLWSPDGAWYSIDGGKSWLKAPGR